MVSFEALLICLTPLFLTIQKTDGFSLLSLTTPKRTLSVKLHMTDEEREIAMDKALKSMTAFSNKYCQNTGTSYCSDLSVPAVVIKGLAEHKVNLGTPLCPCRFYDDKEKEAKEGYWNCPCVPMRERHECHCMLFLTEDNDFAGDQNVSILFAHRNLSLRLQHTLQILMHIWLYYFARTLRLKRSKSYLGG